MNLKAIFGRCFCQALDSCGEKPSRHGFRDFLFEVPEESTAQQIAGLALQHFCTTDGRFNNNQVGLLATIFFLQQCTGRPASERALKEAKSLLTSEPTSERLTQWAVRHFPNR